ncbi:MAG: hypothetical protein QOH39_1899 [Verrucomicrobiota bacterium]|jgi:D-alanyl-D-alanine dipeptidase
MRWLGLMITLTILSAVATAQSVDPLRDAEQCLAVITESWAATAGTAFLFERNGRSPWQQHGSKMPVVVGKAGMAWGRGMIRTENGGGPVKREGDNRAPAGVFRLESVFGYAGTSPATKMPYLPLTTSILAVNDPRSVHYNRLVDTSQIHDRDWSTAEKMILSDNRYKWGVVVAHNVPPRPGAGSCIFLHVWKSPSTLTSGCTAMTEHDLLSIIRWLDPARTPLLVQLPRPGYDTLRAKYELPSLPR